MVSTARLATRQLEKVQKCLQHLDDMKGYSGPTFWPAAALRARGSIFMVLEGANAAPFWLVASVPEHTTAFLQCVPVDALEFLGRHDLRVSSPHKSIVTARCALSLWVHRDLLKYDMKLAELPLELVQCLSDHMWEVKNDLTKASKSTVAVECSPDYQVHCDYIMEGAAALLKTGKAFLTQPIEG